VPTDNELAAKRIADKKPLEPSSLAHSVGQIVTTNRFGYLTGDAELMLIS